MSLNKCNDIVVLDIGGTCVLVGHIRNGCISTDFLRLDSSTLRVPEAHKQLQIVIEQYAKRHTLNLHAVVLGMPAMLDRKNDEITHCNNIPQLQGQGLNQFLTTALGCKVLLEQDIMLQVLGEWRAGAVRGQKSVFGVYFGTGIGAAFLQNGNVENELTRDIQAGHIPIMAQGKPCQCGNKDCIEAYACGHTLVELAQQSGIPIEQLFAHWHQNNKDTTLFEELNQFILYQAYLLATVCTLFTPDDLLIGGGIPKMAGYPRDELMRKTREHLQKPYPAQNIHFNWASLENQAPMHGALALLER